LEKYYISINILEKNTLIKTIVIKKDLLNKKILDIIINYFEKTYQKVRNIEVIINLKSLIMNAVKKNKETIESLTKTLDNIYYENILKSYILEKYGIFSKD
jgi:hypothetical protein